MVEKEMAFSRLVWGAPDGDGEWGPSGRGLGRVADHERPFG